MKRQLGGGGKVRLLGAGECAQRVAWPALDEIVRCHLCRRGAGRRDGVKTMRPSLSTRVDEESELERLQSLARG